MIEPPAEMPVEPMVEVDDPAPRIRRITLNRPAKRNALNAPLRHQLLAAVRAADADPDVGVVIVPGAGKDFANRAFPAAELEGQTLRVAARIAAVPDEITQLNKRTVHRAIEAMGMHAAVRAGTEAATGEVNRSQVRLS